jgi:formylmethanofuran dehydrogenase subunit E
MISLKEATKFHGHLGPYLVLGLRAGEAALKKFRCKKYFDLDVKVYGANKKPKSCLIDGLQLSTGATYGKGNICKLNSSVIKIEFINRMNDNKIILKFNDNLRKKLDETKNHRDAELLARQLYKADYSKLFNLRLIT